ncbi:MAG: LacI family DNA-binding transcriptional regulator [Gaiellaceae bacterium]
MRSRITAAEVVAALEAEGRARTDARQRSAALAQQPRHHPQGPLVLALAAADRDLLDQPNPFFADVLEAIKSRAGASDCDLLLLTSELVSASDESHSYIARCRGHGVSGMILMGLSALDPQVAALLNSGVPCVVIDAAGLGPRLGHVSSDNVGAAARVVHHLYGLGHRRIATVAGPDYAIPAQERLIGYRSALEELGLGFRENYVYAGVYSHETGAAAMRALLELEEPPDAVFASSDVMAIGAMCAIQGTGLRIPEDIALVGFDDLEYASLVSPRLTTMRQDRVGLGAAATEALLRMIEDPEASPPELRLPCEIVVRESCGATLRAEEPA